ncbi:MAG: hypothetical protein ACRDV0_04390 [Acidimicrobiales bacterium]
MDHAGLSEGLVALAYARRSEDLVRYVDDPNDDAVRRVVGVLAESRRGGPVALEEGDLSTLGLYAERRVVAARRRASLTLVDDVLDCYALFPRVTDVPWDSWMKAAVFIARDAGRDLDSMQDVFVTNAPPAMARRFDVVLESMNRVESLAQCHVAEVTTSYGVGLLKTLVLSDTSTTGSWLSTPRRPDDVVGYAPSTNLAQVAASLADDLEQTHAMVAGPIVQSQLAGSLFSLIVPGAFVPTSGCLSVAGDAADHGTSLTAYVAEPSEGYDAADLAAAATGAGLFAVADGTRLVVLLDQPNFDRDEDDEGSDDAGLDRYAESVRRALGASWAYTPPTL